MILLIDTALSSAHVSLASEGRIVATKTSANQKEHASFIQPAIAELLKETGTTWEAIKAVAVSNGPGSYTGLRVGLATAKGICFARNIPLICLSTLRIVAGAWLAENKHDKNHSFFVVPMIDARRMEVYTAVYDQDMNEVVGPSALILSEESYRDQLDAHPTYFIGDGSPKWANLCTQTTASFPTNTQETAFYMALMATESFNMQDFNDLAYAEPFYIKDFHTTALSKR
ncbi:tRNA (adenosine(37)-N6)-threonylcarbamoyltransferase complex dimerization subunit type 1 TsaB [Parasegetibacter sp. NRK P23]|uniref:tRNA (adenosine(37)-N6)-threonylcarbamoyltransferase complex dimerization subunit type 1 TsaB n=1 Tax=Parasegetibacter sp. NRK P23 TaxID=2942999 RepID=UPI00204379AF|nr:tRNA (adenosine(37)-N6)-threonylcarbamoyltransferase complex dimerization subunit type 1 TsaB [Parasegetibacter sp. NRK P23]MCM5527417.1 tRNA (adenosine(37)-N6)-threonylcarbamoyltransferase complex dimerization subunit type 1 TsaB [Parasegetibacter sp. NRK P23]